jgi:hypothetical protein
MKKATTTGEQLVSAAKVSDHKPVQSPSVKQHQEQRSVTTQRSAPHATAPMVPSEHVVLNFTF